MRTEQQLAAELSAVSCSIQAAEAAGRSDRYTAPLYRKMFMLEDALRAFGSFR